jgi:hypothetical protein
MLDEALPCRCRGRRQIRNVDTRMRTSTTPPTAPPAIGAIRSFFLSVAADVVLEEVEVVLKEVEVVLEEVEAVALEEATSGSFDLHCSNQHIRSTLITGESDKRVHRVIEVDRGVKG